MSEGSGSDFTFISVAIAVLVLIGAGAVLLPSLGRHNHGHHHMRSSTQIRGIHQAMVMYAAGNVHDGVEYFPGTAGKDQLVDGGRVAGRMQILIDDNYFTPEYMVAPRDTAITEAKAGAKITARNYSYALLSIEQPGRRRAEWTTTLNSDAPAVADRNTGSDTQANINSLRSNRPGTWEGAVAWNDNHVTHETDAQVDTEMGHFQYTNPSTAVVTQDDHLFEAAGPDDAYLVHDGK